MERGQCGRWGGEGGKGGEGGAATEHYSSLGASSCWRKGKHVGGEGWKHVGGEGWKHVGGGGGVCSGGGVGGVGSGENTIFFSFAVSLEACGRWGRWVYLGRCG